MGSEAETQIYLAMTTKKARGRPPKFDKDQAVRVARQLFHAKGYEGVGVAELSSEIGINPPSLYAAFGNKQKLYELALDDYIATDSCWMFEALSSDAPVREMVSALFAEAAKEFVAAGKGRGCMVLNGTHGSHDDTVNAPAQQRCAATRKRIKARIKQELPEAAELLTDYVMLVLHGLSAGASAGWTQGRMRRAAESAAAGFIAQAGPVN